MGTKNAIRTLSNSVLLKYRRRRMLTMRYGLPAFFIAVVMLVFLRLRTPLSVPLWKQPTLLNLSFSWISNNENLCHQDQNRSEHRRIFPILIHSSRSNFEKRRIIRQTWGSIRAYKNWDVRLIFLLGKSNLTEKEPAMEQLQDEENRLRDEQMLYQDLVIGSFIDSYRNLSLKSLMGYKWILNFCREAQFIWKVDDDVFFDTIHWLDWHSNETEKVSKNKNYTLPDLLCILHSHLQPTREIPGRYVRWAVSYQEWPNPLYPQFCSGIPYSVQLDFMEKIYAVSNSRKMLPLEDVYITGVLREAAEKTFNITSKIKNIGDETRYNYKELDWMCRNKTFYNKRGWSPLILVHFDAQYYMQCFWDKVLYDREKLEEKSDLDEHFIIL